MTIYLSCVILNIKEYRLFFTHNNIQNAIGVFTYMKNLGYYNGRYDLIENMTVPMNDRACFFGDGIYEAVYTRNHKIYALDEHLDRFYDSAEVLGIVIPHTREELTSIIEDLVLKVDDDELLVYFQVSRGTEMRNHAPSKDLVGNIWITIKPAKLRDCYTPMKLITFPDTRYLHCNMKTLNLLPSVLASKAAAEAEADEAVFHRGEIVTECAHSNISIIKNRRLITAPADNMILAGVARAHLLRTCKKLGIEYEEKHYTLAELMDADEIIVTASGTLCRPVSEIDGKKVGLKAESLVSALRESIISDFMRATDI